MYLIILQNRSKHWEDGEKSCQGYFLFPSFSSALSSKGLLMASSQETVTDYGQYVNLSVSDLQMTIKL